MSAIRGFTVFKDGRHMWTLSFRLLRKFCPAARFAAHFCLKDFVKNCLTSEFLVLTENEKIPLKLKKTEEKARSELKTYLAKNDN